MIDPCEDCEVPCYYCDFPCKDKENHLYWKEKQEKKKWKTVSVRLKVKDGIYPTRPYIRIIPGDKFEIDLCKTLGVKKNERKNKKVNRQTPRKGKN